MAIDLNQCTIAGVVRSLRINERNNGGRTYNYGLSWNPRRKDKSGEWEQSSWFNCVTFTTEQSDKWIGEAIQDGANLFVTGQMKQERWVDKDGIKQSKYVIYTDQVKSLEATQSTSKSSRRRGDGDDEGWEEGGEREPRSRTSRNPSGRASATKEDDRLPWDDDGDDDLKWG